MTQVNRPVIGTRHVAHWAVGYERISEMPEESGFTHCYKGKKMCRNSLDVRLFRLPDGSWRAASGAIMGPRACRMADDALRVYLIRHDKHVPGVR